MAQRTTVTYIDDLDGTEIKDGKGGAVRFGFDGADYVIDLTDKNRREFEKVLMPYVNAASPHRATKRGSQKPASRGDAARIRSWARDHGYKVPDRGRIPADIREAYKGR